MIVPKFMRFYGYTRHEVMNEFAISFFGLVNSMYQVIPEEMIRNVYSTAAAMSDDPQGHIEKLQDESQGLSRVIKEAETLRKVRENK